MTTELATRRHPRWDGGHSENVVRHTATDSAPWLRALPPVPDQARHRYLPYKRALEIALILSATPVLLPVMALCALAIKLSDPKAPVLFRQARTGMHGQRFEMLKFRTMVPEAERLKEQLREVSARRWPDFKLVSDPRVTTVGRILRRLSLDELPQIWNVVRGEMSLVGPRPTSFGIDTYEPWQLARLEALPGMTGLWQVTDRGRSEFDERVRLDLAYLERQSLRLDLAILTRTIPAMLSRDRGSW